MRKGTAVNRAAVETRLLARVREQRGRASIPRRDRQAAARLSFAQMRLWLLDRLAPQSPEYVIPCAFRIYGCLDVAALESAFRAVAQRHEVLRTRFEATGDEPLQVIDPISRIAVELVDVSGEPGADGRERAGLAAIEHCAAVGFDLAAEHPIRVTVVRLADDDHLLLVALHHIAADGWSMEVLSRELQACYDAALTGGSATLAELPVQYADYAAWQRDRLTGEVLERQLGYWRERLAGLEPLELPTDLPRPIERSAAGDRMEFGVPPEVTRRLARLAAGRGSSLFMAALAAFQIVLSRWSGQDDVVVGSPISGRNRADSEELIGFFVNTLVLRTDTSGDPTFDELLGRVRDTALGAYAHQDVPFERLVEELSPERDLTRNPLFQVSFAFQNFSENRWELPGADVESVDLATTTSKFDLLLALAEQSDGGLHGEITFSTELFDKATAERLAAHYLRVLDQVSADAGQRIGRIDLLTEAERSQILSEWNNTSAPFAGSPETIHGLVEVQAARTPDAIAVAYRDQRLTYAELHVRADRLAAHLHRLGIARGARVGVCAERSPELVVALLGVLKAGAAFVPLDPEYPAERLQFMLKDAEIRVVVSHAPVRDQVPTGAETVIDLDVPEAMPPLGHRALPVGPDDVAYVIYTSGSTGTPKGVPNTHRGVVNRLLWGQETFRLTPADRVLQKTPYSFDVSVWEFFWPLLAGARLVMAEPGGHRDPEYLRSVLLAERVTTVHFVPSMLRAFLDAVDLTEFTDLRQAFCSGEALPADLARRFLEAGLPCQLHNLYGPTEASIEVSHWTCRLDDSRAGVPIGRPIRNTELLIIDKAGQLAPVGVPGELWIGGVGVALGYLNLPELTAERFIRHPFAPDPSALVYRTGDLVRWRPDGAIEYLGRIDRQVKLRGLRIEPGEIESVLNAHDSVASSVVIVREDSPCDQRLVAYGVPAPGRTLDATELRLWCRNRLPGYMTPGWVVALDEIPLTRSGKVDRRALPRPVTDRPASDHAGPRTDAERLVADIWAEVLGQDHVDIHDNFFDVGGHSLLGSRLVNRMNRELGADLSLRTLFTGPTVAQLAAQLNQAGGQVPAWKQDDHLAPVLTVRHHGDRTPLFCVHPAMGLGWSFTTLLPHMLGRPVHTLQSPALTDKGPLAESLEAIAAQYVRTIQSIQPRGPYLLIGRSFGGLAAFEMAVQLEERGESVALLALLDSLPAAPEGGPDPGQREAVAQDSLRILWRNGLPDESVPSGAMDRTQTVAAVRAADGPMHGWSEQRVNRLLDVCTTHIELSAAYQPKAYRGRLHFFAAAADPDSLPTSEKAAIWRGFAPDLVVRELDCRHSEVLTPIRAAEVADELSRVLADLGH